MRAAISLVLAAAVAWLGGSVLGEYPFDGLFPIMGGGLLGLVVTAVPRAVWRGRAPLLVGLAAAAFGALGEAMAVEIDTANLAPWPWEGYAAVGAAALIGIARARTVATEVPRDQCGSE